MSRAGARGEVRRVRRRRQAQRQPEQPRAPGPHRHQLNQPRVRAAR
jgi:hypothetical protein